LTKVDERTYTLRHTTLGSYDPSISYPLVLSGFINGLYAT